MKVKPRWVWRGAVAVVLLAAAFLFCVPFLNADFLRQPVHGALHRTLGREVEFRGIALQALPRPAVTLTDLVIPETPAFGLEPVAYVAEMELGLAWRSLISRRIEVAGVRLLDSSINIALHSELGWNVARLLGQMGEGVKSGDVPAVELSACRINFRTGLTKSIYFLNNVDLALSSRGAGQYRWSFEASPARTDRAEYGFGRVTGAGNWRAGPEGGELDVRVELESSALPEVSRLLTGQDLGLQGRIASRGRISGPPGQLAVRGVLELAGLERPSLFGLRQPDAGLAFEGKLDLVAGALALSTAGVAGASGPLAAASVEASGIWDKPHWEGRVRLNGFPAQTFLDLARQLGAGIPDSFAADGLLSGEVAVAAGGSLQGTVFLRNADVRLGNAGPLAIEEAEIRLTRDGAELLETSLRAASGNETLVSGRWTGAPEELQFRLRSARLALTELASARENLGVLPPLPLLDRCRGGQLAGDIEFSRTRGGTAGTGGAWSGVLLLRGSSCDVEGAAAPVQLRQAALSFRGGSWNLRRIRGVWKQWPVEGEAVFQPELARPLRFRLSFHEADWAGLEALFRPTLQRQRSFLERTLRLRRGAELPWLARRRAEGTVSFDRLVAGGQQLERVEALLYWDGATLEAPRVSGRVDGARLEGRLRTTFSPGGPQYQLLATLQDYPWQGGWLEGDIDLRASGAVAVKLDTLRGSGNFRALRLRLGEQTFRSLQGAWDLDLARRPRRLRLLSLEAVDEAGETWTGMGAGTPEGLLTIELTQGRRSQRLHGTLWPPRFPAPDAETDLPR